MHRRLQMLTSFVSSLQEDKLLLEYVGRVLESDPKSDLSGKWVDIATNGGSGRTAKQCRDRWMTNLSRGPKKGAWTTEEEKLIRDLHDAFGPRYVAARRLVACP
jgi:hypothetical protein